MNKEIALVNCHLVKFYTLHGVDPIRLEVGANNKTLYIYSVEDTKEVWELWKSQVINYKK